MTDRMQLAIAIAKQNQMQARKRILDYDRKNEELKKQILEQYQSSICEFLSLVTYCCANQILDDWIKERLLNDNNSSEIQRNLSEKLRDGEVNSGILLEQYTKPDGELGMQLAILGAGVTLRVTPDNVLCFSNQVQYMVDPETFSRRYQRLLQKFLRKYKDMENWFYKEFDEEVKRRFGNPLSDLITNSNHHIVEGVPVFDNGYKDMYGDEFFVEAATDHMRLCYEHDSVRVDKNTIESGRLENLFDEETNRLLPEILACATKIAKEQDKKTKDWIKGGTSLEQSIIDISKATYTDHWDNEEGKEIEVYCSLPDDMAADLCRGRFKEAFERALKQEKDLDVSDVKPHAEIQLRCPYDEDFFTDGAVAIAIGIESETCIEELDVINLYHNRDYKEADACRLWDVAMEKVKKG